MNNVKKHIYIFVKNDGISDSTGKTLPTKVHNISINNPIKLTTNNKE